MPYYLCWEKHGSKEWLVKARNAEQAREKLGVKAADTRCAPHPKKLWDGEVIE